MKVGVSNIRPIRRLLAGLFIGAIGLMTPSALADDLPKADDILEKYIKVTGGRAAYEKRENITIHSTIEFAAAGVKGTAIAYQAPPAKSYTAIELEGMGKIEEGCDGKVAWDMNPMSGPRVKEDAELEFAIRTSTFNGELHWKKLFKSVETVAAEDVEGKKTYKVKFTPNKGKEQFQYYDADSGLIVKATATIESQMGDLPVETTFVEYAEFDGVKIGSKIKQSIGGGMQTINVTIDKVESNTKMPSEKFDLPKEIKELLDKPKAASAKPEDKPAKTTDEPKKAEPKKEEPKKDEPKKEEPKKP